MKRRTITGLAALFTLFIGFPALATAADPNGTWLRDTGSSRIRVATCGKALCGSIVWLRKPRKDVRNPNPARKSRSLLGTTIFYGMKPTGKTNQWRGSAYNPEDGKTYTGYMSLQGANALKTEGCVLGGLICRSVTWRRVK